MSDEEGNSEIECVDIGDDDEEEPRVTIDFQGEEYADPSVDQEEVKDRDDDDDEDYDEEDDDEEGEDVSDNDVELDEEGNKVEYEKAPEERTETRKERIQKLRDTRMENAESKRRCLDLSAINNIRNKTLRRQEMLKYLKVKKRTKKEDRKKRRKEGIKTEMRTIENTREPDGTMVGNLEDEDNKEVAQDIAQDEFSDYFQAVYEPKVLVTFSDNPHNKTRAFGFELCRLIPNSTFRFRNRSGVKKIVNSCKRESYTDIVIINEDNKEPNGMVVIHLPDGPTAHFRLSNVKTTAGLRRDYKGINTHRPEVILNNFGTRLGNTVARMLAALFHYDPEFKGRRAVTFHNQRDYIFFRNHRYEFKSNKKVSLRELGPRFTLRLRSLQKGTFDTKTGEYEWIINNRRHAMETNRRTFFL